MRLEYWMCIDFCLRTRSTARSNYYNNSSKSRVDLSLPHKIRTFTFVFGFFKTPNESTIFCLKHVGLIYNPNIETYQGVTSVVWLLDYPLTWWQKCGKRGRTERLEESEQPQNVWMTSLTKLRCCRLLLFWSGENLLHCNLRENGSALLLQFCGKFILLLTFHNFKAFSLIEICWWPGHNFIWGLNFERNSIRKFFLKLDGGDQISHSFPLW